MRGRKTNPVGVTIKYLVLLFLLFLFFLPIFSMFTVSLKSEAEIFKASPALFPEKPVWKNYESAAKKFPYLQYLWNTIFISALYTLGCTLTSAMAGYAFARFQIRANRIFFTIVLSSIMIPYVITIIPFYLLIKNLGLTDKHILWLFYGLGGAPFMIYLYRQFFSTIPASFAESARMDGAGRITIFSRIMLPLVNSGTVITAIFAFQWTWQDYLMPSLFLGAVKTSLAVKLNSAYQDMQQNLLFGQLMAGVFFYIAVPVLVYFIFQKQIMKGMLSGGIKG
ncbi:MAG: carbohydrate ABC transporter permease [Spirochaetales bacterium]|nr:MAG: carbohydrate ABC transporter permease [Spirochaetales bacterium]